MGNCQAAEVATVVIQHPGGKVERVYWSISASRVMADNPGHYVAVIITAPSSSSSSSGEGNSASSVGSKHKERRRKSGTHGHAPVKHLKLLRPDDTLLTGHVYRLVSFEEVVRKFETKRHAKLSRLVPNTTTSTGTEMCSSSTSTQGRREYQGGDTITADQSEKDQGEASCDKSEEDAETEELVAVAQALILNSKSAGIGIGIGSRPGQWRPALQTISEVDGT